jgi:hypothetical protein
MRSFAVFLVCHPLTLPDKAPLKQFRLKAKVSTDNMEQ